MSRAPNDSRLLPWPIRAAFIVACLGVIGLMVWVMKPGERGPCTSQNFDQLSDGQTCEIDGAVHSVPEESQRVNRTYQFDGKSLDSFVLEDAAGEVLIYYPLDQIDLPADGTKVHVTSTVQSVEAKGIRRLVASRIQR